MRNSFVVAAILLLALNLLTGCGSSGKGGSVSATPTTSYETVPWAKLWNSAFADELNGKRVRLEAMWIEVAQSQMDVSAAFPPYNRGDWVEVGITSLGDTETMGQYRNQKWSVYVPKNRSDVAFSLEKGTNVMIYGVAKKTGYASGIGGSGQIGGLVLEIERIEKGQ